MSDTIRIQAVKITKWKQPTGAPRLYEAEVGRVTAQGTTPTEAKGNLAAAVSAALDGEYQPELIVWFGRTILVYRDPRHGWVTQFCNPDGGRSSCCMSADTRIQSIRRARIHLAQLAYNVESNNRTDAAAIILESIPGMYSGVVTAQTEDYMTFVDHCDFQQRYRQASLEGYNDNDCHAIACGYYQAPKGA